MHSSNLGYLLFVRHIFESPGPDCIGGHYFPAWCPYVCHKKTTRLESYNDPRPSTILKSGLIFDRFVLFCTYVYVRTYVRTDTITRNNEPLFKLVLWFVLGRGSKKYSTTLKKLHAKMKTCCNAAWGLVGH